MDNNIRIIREGSYRHLLVNEVHVGEMEVCASRRIENAVEIWGFGIVNKYQGLGFGQQFLQEVINQYKEGTIILFVYKNNARAIHIYEKLGFRITGEYKCGTAWEMHLLPQN